MKQLKNVMQKIIDYVKNEFDLHIGVTHHHRTMSKAHSICFHKLWNDVA